MKVAALPANNPSELEYATRSLTFSERSSCSRPSRRFKINVLAVLCKDLMSDIYYGAIQQPQPGVKPGDVWITDINESGKAQNLLKAVQKESRLIPADTRQVRLSHQFVLCAKFAFLRAAFPAAVYERCYSWGRPCLVQSGFLSAPPLTKHASIAL